jgi:hypothetical protein
VKITPAVCPTLALPTAKIPVEESDTPAGQGDPLLETPKLPPFATPVGNVVDRSNVVAVPARKYGNGLTFHDCAAGGGGEGVGDGVGPGVGAGTGVGLGEGVGVWPETEASSTPPHPAIRVAQPNRLSFKTLRRSTLSMQTPSSSLRKKTSPGARFPQKSFNGT